MLGAEKKVFTHYQCRIVLDRVVYIPFSWNDPKILSLALCSTTQQPHHHILLREPFPPRAIVDVTLRSYNLESGNGT